MRWLWLFLVPFVALLSSTCSTNDGSTITTAASGSGASSGNGSSNGGGLIHQECDPACVAPQFCSVTGVCLNDGECADPGDCPDGAECTNGVCGGCNPPNLLVVLDRSCSMTSNVGTQTKWQIAVAALNKLTTDFQSKIRFGITLFPDTVTPDCQQDMIPIPVGDGNEPAMQTLLTNALAPADAYFPDGPCVTNIDTAMQQAATEPAFNDTVRDSYAILLTDGKQANCNEANGDNVTLMVLADLLNRGVKTFVIGFDVGSDPGQLNAFATAGGVPTNDTSCNPPCQFYNAEDAVALQVALDSIASAVSCGGMIE